MKTQRMVSIKDANTSHQFLCDDCGEVFSTSYVDDDLTINSYEYEWKWWFWWRWYYEIDGDSYHLSVKWYDMIVKPFGIDNDNDDDDDSYHLSVKWWW